MQVASGRGPNAIAPRSKWHQRPISSGNVAHPGSRQGRPASF